MKLSAIVVSVSFVILAIAVYIPLWAYTPQLEQFSQVDDRPEIYIEKRVTVLFANDITCFDRPEPDVRIRCVDQNGGLIAIAYEQTNL